MPLTEEQVKKYVEGGGAVCPYCGSHDVSGGSINIEGAGAYQEITCQACDEEWVDCYTLTNATD